MGQGRGHEKARRRRGDGGDDPAALDTEAAVLFAGTSHDTTRAASALFSGLRVANY
jgi:hypothetical protein